MVLECIMFPRVICPRNPFMVEHLGGRGFHERHFGKLWCRSDKTGAAPLCDALKETWSLVLGRVSPTVLVQFTHKFSTFIALSQPMVRVGLCHPLSFMH